MFASQSFEIDATPDDIKPVILYETFPELCAGIVMFDILIANRDRGKWNIKVNNPDSPTLVRLIDHERSLFYCYPKEGEKELLSRVDRLGITPLSRSDGERHCLIKLIDDEDLLFLWVQRIWDIPEWFIESICREVRRMPLTESEYNSIVKWLTNRRAGIGSLIGKHRDRFPMVKKWQNLFM